MMKVLDTTVDAGMLVKDLELFLSTYNLWDEKQISLTSISGNNDWDCTTGSMLDMPKPERYYSTLNDGLQNTYMGELIKKYKNYYRWRLLCVTPMSTYTIHHDTFENKINKRIHIPITTNEHAYFCFFDKEPSDGEEVKETYYNLKPGTVYEANTSILHTAINHGQTSRYHMVGVRYEDAQIDK